MSSWQSISSAADRLPPFLCDSFIDPFPYALFVSLPLTVVIVVKDFLDRDLQCPIENECAHGHLPHRRNLRRLNECEEQDRQTSCGCLRVNASPISLHASLLIPVISSNLRRSTALIRNGSCFQSDNSVSSFLPPVPVPDELLEGVLIEEDHAPDPEKHIRFCLRPALELCRQLLSGTLAHGIYLRDIPRPDPCHFLPP